MELLRNHPWRGNVRELANFIERAVILSLGEELKVPAGALTACYSTEITPSSTFEQAERNGIVDALKAPSGRISGKGGAAERWLQLSVSLPNRFRSFRPDSKLWRRGPSSQCWALPPAGSRTHTEPDRHTEASMVPTFIENVRAALLLVWCDRE